MKKKNPKNQYVTIDGKLYKLIRVKKSELSKSESEEMAAEGMLKDGCYNFCKQGLRVVGAQPGEHTIDG